MTNLGVDQILEAYDLVKLLGLSVALEHRGVNNERRDQVRLEKDSGGFSEAPDDPHGGKLVLLQGRATGFREPHPLNPSCKVVQIQKGSKQREGGCPRQKRGQRRREGELKMRSKTVATDRVSNVVSHGGGSQYGGRLVVSQEDDHCYEARGNGDGKEDWAVYDGRGLQGSTVVTSLGELFVSINQSINQSIFISGLYIHIIGYVVVRSHRTIHGQS